MMIEDRLYELHSYLTIRYFKYGLTFKESLRLKSIRFNLDEIEMKQMQPYFKRMESKIEENLKLGDSIVLFINYVESFSE